MDETNRPKEARSSVEECARRRKLLAEEFDAYRKVFLALGDETRQQIFLTLLEHDAVGMRVPELTARIHLSRPAVSHHLQILKESGLIAMHLTGTRNYYYVDANESCWRGLKDLVDHVDLVVRAACRSGYPNFKEDDPI